MSRAEKREAIIAAAERYSRLHRLQLMAVQQGFTDFAAQMEPELNAACDEICRLAEEPVETDEEPMQVVVRTCGDPNCNDSRHLRIEQQRAEAVEAANGLPPGPRVTTVGTQTARQAAVSVRRAAEERRQAGAGR